MDGKRYTDLWEKQARKDVEMLGASRWSPMCLARDEDNGQEWAEEYWLRKAELIKSVGDGSDIYSRIVMQRMHTFDPSEQNENDNEYDWVGKFMQNLTSIIGCMVY